MAGRWLQEGRPGKVRGRCSKAVSDSHPKATQEQCFCYGGGRYRVGLCKRDGLTYRNALLRWVNLADFVGPHRYGEVEQCAAGRAGVVDSFGVCRCCANPKPAEQVVRFCFDGDRFKVALCAAHVDMFDWDMLGWIRVAESVSGGHEPPPSVPRQRRGGDVDPNRATANIRMLVALANERAASSAGGDTSATDVQPGPAARLDSLDLGEWYLTHHCGIRALQRNISIDDLVKALRTPEMVAGSRTSPGNDIYSFGNVRLVVNPVQKVLVTVFSDGEAEPDQTGIVDLRRSA